MASFKILPACPASPSLFSNNGVGTTVDLSDEAAKQPLKDKWIKKVTAGKTTSRSASNKKSPAKKGSDPNPDEDDPKDDKE